MRQGQLVYVMGASGSGKDSLLQALRPRLRGVPVAFARRYITRPLSAKGERHIAVSPERFIPRCLAAPKYTRNKSTSCGMILTISR